MTIDEMKEKLEKVLTPKRFEHSVNVMKTGVKLAERYGDDRKKAETAGLLHDCARDISKEETFRLCKRYKVKVDDISLMQPELLHGPLGSVIAREEFGVADNEVLSTIFWHTTGRENMTLLEKIIFIADYIEPTRNFKGVEEVRKAAYDDINISIVMALDKSIRYIIDRGRLIHTGTVNARNFLIKQTY